MGICLLFLLYTYLPAHIIDIKEGYRIFADNGSDQFTQSTVDIYLTGYRDSLSGQTAVYIAGYKSKLCLERRPALSCNCHIFAVPSVLLNPVL